MSEVKSYQDLEVWKNSLDLVERVYYATKNIPTDERFGLTSQLRRAAVSIPSNIAEGAARHGTGEFLQFLGVATGSQAELETQLILAKRRQILSQADFDQLQSETSQVGRMLSGLKRSLQSNRM
jgi:four helix bundle protein